MAAVDRTLERKQYAPRELDQSRERAQQARVKLDELISRNHGDADAFGTTAVKLHWQGGLLTWFAVEDIQHVK